MKHIVSLSGGTASAVTADRVLTRYGLANTTLWFADTSWEDEDLYRFLEDLETYWKITIVR
jgi:3'-phosphoadenosine 5'-phosphosulfate sulfotransferase (PAPS reductase)/FAD synthetase